MTAPLPDERLADFRAILGSYGRGDDEPSEVERLLVVGRRLLGEVNRLTAERDVALASVAELEAHEKLVRRIHHSYGFIDELYCLGCTTGDWQVPYPCWTIRALDGTS